MLSLIRTLLEFCPYIRRACKRQRVVTSKRLPGDQLRNSVAHCGGVEPRKPLPKSTWRRARRHCSSTGQHQQTEVPASSAAPRRSEAVKHCAATGTGFGAGLPEAALSRCPGKLQLVGSQAMGLIRLRLVPHLSCLSLFLSLFLHLLSLRTKGFGVSGFCRPSKNPCELLASPQL